MMEEMTVAMMEATTEETMEATTEETMAVMMEEMTVAMMEATTEETMAVTMEEMTVAMVATVMTVVSEKLIEEKVGTQLRVPWVGFSGLCSLGESTSAVSYSSRVSSSMGPELVDAVRSGEWLSLRKERSS